MWMFFFAKKLYCSEKIFFLYIRYNIYTRKTIDKGVVDIVYLVGSNDGGVNCVGYWNREM